MVKPKKAQTDKDLIRQRAEADLEFFIKLVHPQRVLGGIHVEVIRWWTRQAARSHQLLLLPRDHQKSALVAYRVAWEITRNPIVRFLYISSTANLAIKQLKFIKDILTSDRYRRYWPEMINLKEGMREKWTETEISVDHPLRKAEAIRDPTVFIGGLTSTITGLHCDVAVLDDVVVYENAYTQDGRDKVRQQYSGLSSIEGTGSREWVVGTRYFSTDLYNEMLSMQVETFDTDGTPLSIEPLYEIFGGDDEKKRQVEDVGDGTGQYLWPKQRRIDGREFGFDQNELAKKRAQYQGNMVQYRAQYYNNPNDQESNSISSDLFQYYERRHVVQNHGKWYYKDRRLNLFASIDFAFSLGKKADSTSIVVVGIDNNRNYYILDIDRFKTFMVGDYFNHILRLHQKWGFRKIRAEVSVGQKVIVEDLKQNYIRVHGLALSVEEFRPTRSEGSKEERVLSILQPRYQNNQIWHYVGGYCQTLEEELILQKPPHDDIKDALASCIASCIAPGISGVNPQSIGNYPSMTPGLNLAPNYSRFGGMS